MPTTYVKLFYNGSNKLQTANTGVVVTGILTATSSVNVGSGITLSPDGDVFAVGVSTFTDDIHIKGDGKKLLNIFKLTKTVREDIIRAGQDTDKPDFGRKKS